MAGIGIITNPHSKLNKRNPNRTAILGYILGQKGQLAVTNTLDDLARVARNFREQQIQLLAINGGDGTISRTLTAFLKEYNGDGTNPEPLPRVALLGGGTINVLASNLGRRGTPEEALFRLLEAHSAGTTLSSRRIPSLSVEGNYGFLFANGVAPTFLKEYYLRKSGQIGAAFWCLRTYFSRFFGGELYNRVVRDDIYSLQIDQQAPLKHTSTGIFISTLEKMPFGYRLFNSLPGAPGCFECASFAIAARDAVWKLPVIMVKRFKGSGYGKLSFLGRSASIEAEAPFDYTLDGELYVSHSRQLAVKVGPDIEFVTF